MVAVALSLMPGLCRLPLPCSCFLASEEMPMMLTGLCSVHSVTSGLPLGPHFLPNPPERCPGHQPSLPPGQGWVRFLENSSVLCEEGYVNTAGQEGSNLNRHSIHFNIMKLLSMESFSFLRLSYFTVVFESKRHHSHHRLWRRS